MLKLENSEISKLNKSLILKIDKIEQKYKPLINGKFYKKNSDGSLPVINYVNHVEQINFMEKLSGFWVDEIS